MRRLLTALTAAMIVVTLANPALAWDDDDDDDYRPPQVQHMTPYGTHRNRFNSLPRYNAPPPEAPPLIIELPRPSIEAPRIAPPRRCWYADANGFSMPGPCN